MNNMRYATTLALIFTLSQSLYAQHTFSIVAVDTMTNEVGSAGATCLDSDDCSVCNAIIISGLVPGRGAVNAQAQICLPNVNLNIAINDLQGGLSPQEVLDNRLMFDNCITTNGIGDKQYGIVDLDGNGGARVAAFTGDNTLDIANHITGVNYSIQGNILISEEVLTDMETGFNNTEGTLAEKLMGAMQGANIPGADSRCLPQGISSKSAFVRVACPNDISPNFCLDLNVVDMPDGVDPIDSLQNMFDQLVDVEFPSNEIPVKIFPTITDDFIQIEFENTGQYHVQIADINGAIMITNSTENNMQLDVSHLSSGIYFVQIAREGNYFTQKIVIR